MPNANPSVLGTPTFGNVELGKELDTRDHRVVHLARRLGRWCEHPIETEARGESGACGFEVDVARASLVGVPHEEVHITNDRRLVREIADIRREVLVDP